MVDWVEGQIHREKVQMAAMARFSAVVSVEYSSNIIAAGIAFDRVIAVAAVEVIPGLCKLRKDNVNRSQRFGLICHPNLDKDKIRGK